MAKYYIDDISYDISLDGLYIHAETESPICFSLSPINGVWPKCFEKNHKWDGPDVNRVLFLYAQEQNPFDVDRITIAWWFNDPKDSSGELSVDIDDLERAYLKGLLVQYHNE